MIRAVLLTLVTCLLMTLPYLPGRFDASAAALSFVARAATYTSLLLIPVGLLTLLSPRRSRLWRRLTIAVAAFVAFVTVLAATAVNQLSLGLMLGILVVILLRWLSRRSAADVVGGGRALSAITLMAVPALLVAYQMTVLPRAAAWSRDRAISHSARLIDAIEAFHQRRGHYPHSLQSLNRDVPTGVVGIERFHYEPNGESYNLFFIRPHIELDAMEVVLFNPRDEHRFTSHEMDILQYDGEQLDGRRGDRRRTPLANPHWISILFD